MFQVHKSGMSDLTHCCGKNTWQLKEARVYCNSQNGETELIHHGAEGTKNMKYLHTCMCHRDVKD